MAQIHHFDNDLSALNNKRRELEINGFRFVRDAKDDDKGAKIIEGLATALIESGVSVVILKTRGLIDIWANNAGPKSKG